MRVRAEPDLAFLRERGFALLIVLWTVVLLTLLVTQLTSAGRGEAQIAANLRRDAAAELAADGAVQASMFHMLDGSGARWLPDGTERALAVSRGRAAIVLRDQGGKVNPNTAQADLLSALVVALGTDPHAAGLVAQAIVDWRTPPAMPGQPAASTASYRAAGLSVAPAGLPFGSVDDVALVRGMTPALFARLRPHLSVFSVGEPRLTLADPVVAQALRALGAGGVSDAVPEVTVVEVTATVRMASGAVFSRRATVQVGGSALTPWRMLDWEQD
ncbi:MAG: hypothetical protein ACRYG6_13875 [Janthinobacterium lividum]